MAQRFRENLQVHINVAFDAPLVDATLPDHTSGDGVREPVPAFVDHGEVAVDLSKNTLVIAGDEAWEVEGLQDVPTIAEPSAPDVSFAEANGRGARFSSVRTGEKSTGKMRGQSGDKV